jgi:hypothetical protein
MPAGVGKARLVHADLTGEEFEAEWKAVQLWLRLAIYTLAPAVGLHRRWFASRSSLAKDMACDYEPSLAELMAITPETGALTQAVLHARDRRILERLSAELDDLGPKSIAVVYGAAHMRAVVRELTTNRAFAVEAAEWRTLMSAVQ